MMLIQRRKELHSLCKMFGTAEQARLGGIAHVGVFLLALVVLSALRQLAIFSA
jgi:hypothetical protein